jgi:aspergillopepsin I
MFVDCFGAVKSNSGANLQIYGDIFFKSQFVAFDNTGPSIGVAPHAA